MPQPRKLQGHVLSQKHSSIDGLLWSSGSNNMGIGIGFQKLGTLGAPLLGFVSVVGPLRNILFLLLAYCT